MGSSQNLASLLCSGKAGGQEAPGISSHRPTSAALGAGGVQGAGGEWQCCMSCGTRRCCQHNQRGLGGALASWLLQDTWHCVLQPLDPKP